MPIPDPPPIPEGEPASRTFREWVKAQRRTLGLPQQIIADQVGCSLQTLRKIEQQIRHPSQQLAERLASTLRIPEQDRAHFIALARGLAVVPPEDDPAPSPGESSAARISLPYQLAPFIGRTQQLHAINTLLGQYRLITLSGSGGIGKTRLALELAHQRVARYAHGVWLVDLTPISDPTLILKAVAAALGVREKARDELEATLISALQPQQRLIVLDNCEHVLAAAARLVHSIVRHCPDIMVLATSRERLGLAGEIVYHVPPLRLPAADTSSEQMEDSEAVQLFLEHASAVQPKVSWSSSEIRLIAEVCARLDGLPLAIELAARRTNVFSISQLLARLDQRLSLLEAAPHTGAPHHHTLRALIGWSYALLSSDEQCLFRQLTVFPGSWTLEAAEAVCSTGPLTSTMVAVLLGHLIDKSLVVRDSHHGSVRYRLLETIRQYANEQTIGSDEQAILRDAHLGYFLQHAVEGWPHLYDGTQREWLATFEAEHENFQAALDWSLAETAASGRLAASMLQLAGILWRFWARQGHLTLGRQWLERVRACDAWGRFIQAGGVTAPNAMARYRTQVLLGSGYLAMHQGDFIVAEELIAASVRQAQLTVPAALAEAMLMLGWTINESGDSARARPIFDECLEIARATSDTYVLAHVLNTLAWIAWVEGDNEQAVRTYAESLEYFEQCQHLSGKVLVLNNMALLLLTQQQQPRAQSLIAEALSISYQIGDKRYLAYAHCTHGLCLALQEALKPAIAAAYQGLMIYHQIGDQMGMINSLIVLAYVLAIPAPAPLSEARWPARLCDAVFFMSAVNIKRRSLGVVVVEPSFQYFHELACTQAPAHLDQQIYAEIWQAGQEHPFEDAVAHALAIYGPAFGCAP